MRHGVHGLKVALVVPRRGVIPLTSCQELSAFRGALALGRFRVLPPAWLWEWAAPELRLCTAPAEPT